MKNSRNLVIALTLILSLLTQCCGGFSETKEFRLTAIGFKVVVQGLVPNVLTQAKADIIKRDFDDSANATIRADTCLAGATGDQKEIKRAQCFLTLANDLRVILAHHHIAGHPTLDMIAEIIQAAIDAFREFHDAVVPAPGAFKGGDVGTAEKELENKLIELKKRADSLK